MRHIFSLFVAIELMFLQTGCVSKLINAAIPQEGKVAEKVKNVKSVAIVAFDTLEYRPTGLASKIAPMLNTARGVQNWQAEETELCRQLVSDLQTELTKAGFKVISMSTVVENKYYQSLAAKVSSATEKATLNPFHKPTVLKGLARAVNPPYQFTEDERKKLITELGVDALVFGRVSFMTTSDTDYLGLGLSYSYLQPVFSFYMFDESESNDAIWFALQHPGPRSDESLGRVSGMENTDVIEKLSRPLARSAMRDFLSKTHR